MERRAGAVLIDRSTEPVGLTEAGLRVLPFARRAIAAVEESFAPAAVGHGVLRIGFTGTPWPMRRAHEHS